MKVKYGVVDYLDVVRDLWEWSDVYSAGRLHKPVHYVFGHKEAADSSSTTHRESRTSRALEAIPLSLELASSVQQVETRVSLGTSLPAPVDWSHWDLVNASRDPQQLWAFFQLAQQHNLRAAFALALLFSPAQVSERSLFELIAGISYLGDVRVAAGAEDRLKVQKLVGTQLPAFRALYADVSRELVAAGCCAVHDVDSQERLYTRYMFTPTSQVYHSLGCVQYANEAH